MTDDSFEAVLADLLAMYPALPELQLKTTHRRVTHIAHGWYMRAHRSSEAAMLLRAIGYAMESWPIRRALLEHVVALKWLAVEGNPVADQVRRAHAKSSKKRKEALIAAEWKSAQLDVFDDVIADIDATDNLRSLDNFERFAHRCRQYGTPNDMAAYLIDTAHSHPSWESAVSYLQHSEQDEIALHLEPKFDLTRDDAGFCAMHLWEALASLNDMMNEPPWTAELATLRARIEVLAG